MKLRKSLFLTLCLPIAFSPVLFANTEIATADAEPVLRELSQRKVVTGAVQAEIDGKKEEFMTTSETIYVSEERLKQAPENARAFIARMNGKTVHTAALRSVAGFIYVGLDAYGNIGERGPGTGDGESTSVKISFALKADTLALDPKQREITYAAPGKPSSESAVGKEVDLTLDSITRLPDGSLGFKGSFSAVLTETRGGKALPKPVSLKGTFDIQRASSDKVIPELLSGK